MKDHELMLQDLRDPDEVSTRFAERGSYSIEIDRALKPQIRKQFAVNNRTLFLQRRSRRSRLWFPILAAYLFWVDVVLDIFSSRDPGYLVVKHFSKRFWGQIASYHGEDVDESTIRITFCRRP